MDVIGIDLAWQSARNTSAAAAASLQGTTLTLHDLKNDLDSVDAVTAFVTSHPETRGVAVDASLIINNQTGQRVCERELGRVYGSRKATCHASNRTLYPEPCSVDLAGRLARHGYSHLGPPGESRWQIECYPHPAIIEIFGLAERYRYKKGDVASRRDGQVGLAGLIRQLERSPVLHLRIDARFDSVLDGSAIQAKRGAALKRNEDALDAIVCTYIAGLYAIRVDGCVYGNVRDGYIYVPQVNCLAATT